MDIVAKINPANILITRELVAKIFTKLNQTIDPDSIDIDHYVQAFTHKSYTVDGPVALGPDSVQLQPNKSQETLEFLGDAILDAIVCEYLFRKYPNANEGHLTKYKHRLVCTKTLANFSRNLGLGRFILLARVHENQRKSVRVLEDTFEAFVCAVYLDQGFVRTREFVMKILDTIDYHHLETTDINFKSQLLERYQKNWNVTPRYVTLHAFGSAQHRMYTIGVVDFLGNVLGQGMSGSKREAEQIASREAIKRFDEIISKSMTLNDSLDDYSIVKVTRASRTFTVTLANGNVYKAMDISEHECSHMEKLLSSDHCRSWIQSLESDSGRH